MITLKPPPSFAPLYFFVCSPSPPAHVSRLTSFYLRVSQGGVGCETGLAVPHTRGHGRDGEGAVGPRREAPRHLLRFQPAHDRLVALHTPGSLRKTTIFRSTIYDSIGRLIFGWSGAFSIPPG